MSEVLTTVKSISKSVDGFGKKIDTLESRVKKCEEWGEKAAKNAETMFAQPRDAQEEARSGFKTPREFLLSVMKHQTTGKVDKRLEGLHVKAAGSDEQMGSNDAYGGFLVPIGFSPDFLKLDPEADPIGSRTRMVPMERPAIRIPARVDKDHRTSVSGGLTVTRRPETIEHTSSRMQVEQIELTAHSLHGIAFATEEILMDSPQTFTALLADGFNDQFTYHMIGERLEGTGIGEYLGILNAPATITVEKEVGQQPETILYDNLKKMRSRCWRYGEAVWMTNHDTVPDLMSLQQALGVAGAIVWHPNAREDFTETLLGRPLIVTEYTKALGQRGDIILANWKEYLEGIYQPLQSAESIHVRFVNHERAFKFWMRNAGQPWWKTSLTPKHSPKTLSPFVVLEDR